jgi:predicted ester cyclase
MALEAAKEMVRRYLADLMSEDWPNRITVYFTNPDELPQFMEEHKAFRQALADYHFEVEGMVGEDDTLVMWGMVTARYVAEYPIGQLKGLPATGERVGWREVWIYRFDGDRVIDFKLVGDSASQLQ